MPINHFSSDFQGILSWTQHPPPNPIMQNHLPSHHHNNNPNPTWISLHHHPKSSMSAAPSLSFNLNLSHDTADSDPFHHPKQPMFEKPLTPSDVGKLNRLVIPKQYAEKYFPLGATGDSSDKGLLLSFEDESGKLWRFRYSYWNSSQSYVLTKGWSRYVKEKRLDAGDVVVFERHRLDGERLFIGWKRRSPAAAAATATTLQDGGSPGAVAASTSGGGWTRMFYSAHPYPSAQQSHHHLPSPPYQSDCPHAESSAQSQTVSAGTSKILRLFGVNLECQTDHSEPEPPSTPSGRSGLTSQDPTHHQFYPHYSSPLPLPHHMDFTFPQDVKQTKYHRG